VGSTGAFAQSVRALSAALSWAAPWALLLAQCPAGGISDETRPSFRTYVSGQKHSSYRYDREVRVGADLPSSGVTYYEVPREYGVTKYRYAVVNDRTVLVIEVID